MRLFIGIDFSSTNQKKLQEVMEHASGQGTSLENLHLTLEFLGELPPSVVSSIQSIFDCLKVQPFHIESKRLSKLKDILILEVKKTQELLSLQEELHQSLKKAGFHLEERPYYPHVTLIRRFHEDIKEEYSLTQEVRSIHLYHSTRVDGVLTYLKIATKLF